MYIYSSVESMAKNMSNKRQKKDNINKNLMRIDPMNEHFKKGENNENVSFSNSQRFQYELKFTETTCLPKISN